MTRPQEAAERFVSALPRAIGRRLTPVYSPLITIAPFVQAIDLGDARGLIFTSVNGVAIAATQMHRRDLPCYCVGESTTKAARQAGWSADFAGPTAEALIESLHRNQPVAPLLHLRGTHSRGAVAARLTAMGCLTREQVIYDQPLLPLTQEALIALNGSDPVLAPLFSPRTARQFANQHVGGAPLHLAALSSAVAKSVKHLKSISIIVSPTPNSTAMAQLVGQMIESADRVEGRKRAQ